MLQSIAVAVPSNEVAAVFNLEDPDERFMVGVMIRFHGEERLYLAHALKRTEGDRGRVVVEIASFNPPERPRTYLVILWEIDTVTIRFKDVASMQEARDVFAAY